MECVLVSSPSSSPHLSSLSLAQTSKKEGRRTRRKQVDSCPAHVRHRPLVFPAAQTASACGYNHSWLRDLYPASARTSQPTQPCYYATICMSGSRELPRRARLATGNHPLRPALQTRAADAHARSRRRQSPAPRRGHSSAYLAYTQRPMRSYAWTHTHTTKPATGRARRVYRAHARAPRCRSPWLIPNNVHIDFTSQHNSTQYYWISGWHIHFNLCANKYQTFGINF